jgi:peptidoglycan hydrolase CwlO-like protein
MDNDYTIITIVGAAISTIIGFFFGKSGIFNRILNNRMQKLEKAQTKEEAQINEYKTENESLHKQIDILTRKVNELEMDLQDTKQRLDIMLAYFEKLNPDPDAFIEKVVKKTKPAK